MGTPELFEALAALCNAAGIGGRVTCALGSLARCSFAAMLARDAKRAITIAYLAEPGTALTAASIALALLGLESNVEVTC